MHKAVPQLSSEASKRADLHVFILKLSARAAKFNISYFVRIFRMRSDALRAHAQIHEHGHMGTCTCSAKIIITTLCIENRPMILVLRACVIGKLGVKIITLKDNETGG